MKRNLILQTAVAAMFGVVGVSAHAGIANGIPVSMAAQAVTPAALLVGGNITYSTQVPTPIGTTYVYVKLNGGAKFAGAAGSAIAAGAIVITNVGAATVTPGAGTISADRTFAYFSEAIGGGSLPIGATITFKATAATAPGGAINAPALGVIGTSQTVTMSLGSAPNPVAPAADVDTASTGNIINSANGVGYTVLSSGATPFPLALPPAAPPNGLGGVAKESKVIDVTGLGANGTTMVAPAGTNTAATLLNFGGYYFSDVPGVVGTDGATPFTFAGNYALPYSATLAGNFGAALGVGGNVFLSTAPACGAVTVSATPGSAATGTAAFASIPAVAANVAYYLCMQINTPGNVIPIPATTPSLVVNLVGAAAAPITTPAASLYPLFPNGGLVDVRTYVPAAAAGYMSIIRVINTGSVTAPISVAVINPTTGAVGGSGSLGSLAAGAAAQFTSAQIEAVVGAIADGSSRPRLRISGPTTLSVQSFVVQPGTGAFTSAHGDDK